MRMCIRIKNEDDISNICNTLSINQKKLLSFKSFISNKPLYTEDLILFDFSSIYIPEKDHGYNNREIKEYIKSLKNKIFDLVERNHFIIFFKKFPHDILDIFTSENIFLSNFKSYNEKEGKILLEYENTYDGKTEIKNLDKTMI